MPVTQDSNREEFEHYFYEILTPEIRKREEQQKELQQETVKGIKRAGNLILALRGKLDLTRQEFATQYDLPLLWVDLAERGYLLPGDITDENLNKVNNAFHQVFPKAAHISKFLQLSIN